MFTSGTFMSYEHLSDIIGSLGPNVKIEYVNEQSVHVALADKRVKYVNFRGMDTIATWRIEDWSYVDPYTEVISDATLL